MLLCGGRTCAGPVQTEACRMLLKILLGFLCGLSSLAAARDTSQRPPPLLLVSFDGFRADYLQTFPMPNLTLLYSQGVLVEQLNNVFITKTFPNHYSLVTGLYAESHGILSSSMYDPATQKHFKPGDDTDPIWWNQAEPLWTTALDSGYKTAAMMWPGSDVAIRNRTATHFFRYNASMTFRERLGHVVKWMLGNETDEAVMFAALYWEEPDRSGHIFGPDNKTVMSMVLKEVDDDIGLLISELKRNGLWGHVNVIVTSDHGMVQCSAERLIRLENCLDPKMYMVVDMTPVAAIIPKKDPEAVFTMLDNCHPHMTAYLKKAIPDRLHYRNNRLIQPIILVADEGWTIVQSGDKPPRLGDHGYDNSLPSMHPFLAATGPSFRQGYRTRELQSVDVYPMMCHLLSVPPRPNNGSLAHSRCLLAGESCMDSPLVVGLVVVVMVVLTIITVLFRLLKSRRPAGPRPFRRLQLDDDDDDDEALLD